MFSGGQRAIAPQYRVTDESLTLRPYHQTLGRLTEKICTESNMQGNDTCLFETRTAFDCVLRQKVQKFGDIMDNQGACKNHIANLKKALGAQNEHIV